MAVVYRRMTVADAGLLSNVAADVFDEPVDPERVANYLASAGHLMVLASIDDLVVGQCTGVIHHHPDKPTELYVDEIGTGSAYLRRGIATAMLAELFDWARELGCEEAWLGTELDNVAANSLYRHIGGRQDTMSYYEFTLRPTSAE